MSFYKSTKLMKNDLILHFCGKFSGEHSLISGTIHLDFSLNIVNY